VIECPAEGFPLLLIFEQARYISVVFVIIYLINGCLSAKIRRQHTGNENCIIELIKGAFSRKQF
jgi:hypothetical protein